MPWFRALINGLPFSIAAFAGPVFHSVRTRSDQIHNEITIAHIGEPMMLNPTLLSTSTDNDIARLIFNGLLRPIWRNPGGNNRPQLPFSAPSTR